MLEVEQAVLGGLMELKNKESDITIFLLNRLKTSFFTTKAHVEIFKAIKTLANMDKQFDSLTVSVATKDNPLVELLDVDRCYSYRSDIASIRQHTESLRDEAIERFTMSKLNDLVDMVANKENGNIKERIGLAESSLNSMINQITEGSDKGLKDGFHWANKWLNNIEDHHSGNLNNYTLGFQGLDELLQPKGIRAGSLVVVGARPKMGKTFFATRAVEHFVKDRGEAACVFSMEMTGEDIYERILSGYSRTNSNQFYTVPMENTCFWDEIGTQNTKLANEKLFIDDAAEVTINHIKNEVRKAHRKNKVGIVVVDYLTLMGGSDKAERNDLKYGEITKQLKILGKELGCLILLLVQLNRGLESRPDKRPVPSDGRDTGQIEQDCDLWIGLYRERVYNKDCPYNFTEAIVRLNRVGESGTAYMGLDNGYFEHIDTIQAQNEILKEETAKQEASENEKQNRQRYSRRDT